MVFDVMTLIKAGEVVFPTNPTRGITGDFQVLQVNLHHTKGIPCAGSSRQKYNSVKRPEDFVSTILMMTVVLNIFQFPRELFEEVKIQLKNELNYKLPIANLNNFTFKRMKK